MRDLIFVRFKFIYIETVETSRCAEHELAVPKKSTPESRSKRVIHLPCSLFYENSVYFELKVISCIIFQDKSDQNLQKTGKKSAESDIALYRTGLQQ